MEIWKKIPGFENYEVSNKGRVKSLDRFINNQHKTKTLKKGRILKQYLNKKGYLQVKICLNGIDKTKRVHRLIAEAFIDNYENKPQVNHINGIKNDNRVDNLEWCTNKENIIHAYKNNLIKVTKGVKHHNSKLNSLKVKEIRNNKNKPCIYYAEKFNVSITTIHNVKFNKIWKNNQSIN